MSESTAGTTGITATLRTFAVAVSVVLLAYGLGGCGVLGGEDDEVADVPKSSVDEPFRIDDLDGPTQQVVGHGVSFEVPDGWVASGDEFDSTDGLTFEWAVQAPEGTPFPPFVNASMGKRGDAGVTFDSAPEAAKELAAISPDFELVDEGEIDVPGAEQAYQLHLRRSDTVGTTGEPVMVEQVQVFLAMPDGIVSTLRFQAPDEQYDDSELQAVLDSLVVASEGQA